MTIPPPPSQPPGRARPAAPSGSLRARTPPITRRLRAAFTERLHLKAAALLFAILLWLVVSAEELSEQVVPVRVALTLDSSIQLRSPVPPVNALVEARGRELLKLWQNPPTLRRKIGADAPDSMTLELRPGDIDLAGVDAQVREIEPHTIPLKFDVAMQRHVPVRSALRIASDSPLAHAGALTFEPESVLVRGRRGVVRTISAVSTAPMTLQLHDTLPQIVPLDTSGLDLTVQPSQVRVRVRFPRDTDRSAPRSPSQRQLADSARSGRDSAARRDSLAGTSRADSSRTSSRPQPPAT